MRANETSDLRRVLLSVARERAVSDVYKWRECHERAEKERTAECQKGRNERRDNRVERAVLYLSRKRRAD